jgi:hypothetical protein
VAIKILQLALTDSETGGSRIIYVPRGNAGTQLQLGSIHQFS